MEPQFINEGPRDWQNLFAIMRFCLIKVLFHILLGERKSFIIPRTLLYRGSLY